MRSERANGLRFGRGQNFRAARVAAASQRHHSIGHSLGRKAFIKERKALHCRQIVLVPGSPSIVPASTNRLFDRYAITRHYSRRHVMSKLTEILQAVVISGTTASVCGRRPSASQLDAS